MSKRFKKSDVTTHSTRDYSGPAINVKVYRFPTSVPDATEAVMGYFNCDKPTAEKALGFAWDMAQEGFWEAMQDSVAELYGEGYTVGSTGRSSGWLYVTGLRELSEWDALDVARWARLVRAVEQEIAWRTSWEAVREDISANRWAEPGAQMYNFRDTATGTECVVDLKRIEQAAPQLLKALKRLLNTPALALEDLEDEDIEACEEAENAVAEAEGKASHV